MTDVPQQYQASTRLVDDPERLRRLYCEEGLTVREIAERHADLGRTMVSNALDDHGITDSESCSVQGTERASSPNTGERGIDPPATTGGVDWSVLS